MDNKNWSALPAYNAERFIDIQKTIPLQTSTASDLVQATNRAEDVLTRLEKVIGQAEEKITDSKATIERSVAVAEELREDVSHLIVALQGLAAEVDAQIRQQTTTLMGAVAEAGKTNKSATTNSQTAALSQDVSALTEELRRTADAIATDLQAKSDELRILIDEATLTAQNTKELRQVAPVYSRYSTHKQSLAKNETVNPLNENMKSIRDEVQFNAPPKSRDMGRYSEAIGLAATGVNADEIAKRCNLGREEVRMLLQMQKQQSAWPERQS